MHCASCSGVYAFVFRLDWRCAQYRILVLAFRVVTGTLEYLLVSATTPVHQHQHQHKHNKSGARLQHRLALQTFTQKLIGAQNIGFVAQLHVT